MYKARKFFVVVTLLLSVELFFVVSLLRDRRSQPYHVDRAALSGWTVVLGAPEDPWVVALEPPASLTASLFQQLATKVDRPLVAPRHAVLPLVMRPEYDDALQGVYGAMDIQRLARQEMTGGSTNVSPTARRRSRSTNQVIDSATQLRRTACHAQRRAGIVQK